MGYVIPNNLIGFSVGHVSPECAFSLVIHPGVRDALTGSSVARVHL